MTDGCDAQLPDKPMFTTEATAATSVVNITNMSSTLIAAATYFADAPFSLVLDSGSSRTRVPVAAKIALVSAGTNGGTPGSPIPAGGALLSTIVTLVRRG